MKIKKYVWYFICALFCVYCLYNLIKDSHEVVYEEDNETEPIQRLACTELRDIYPNKMEIDLKDLGVDLYRHFNRSDTFMRTLYPKEFEKSILNRTKSGFYLIYNGMVCLIVNEGESSITNLFLPGHVFFAIKRHTFDLVKTPSANDLIEQVVVVKKEWPYSDCDESNSRFDCLNDCFKRQFRLARYHYDSREAGLIYLNLSKNPSVEGHERHCFGKCKRENCKLVQLIPADKSKKSKNATFKAQQKLSDLDFWIQLIGLLCSTAGLCFNDCSSIAIEFTKSKVRRRKIRIGLFYLKFVIIFLTLSAFIYLCTQVALDHQTDSKRLPEREKTRKHTQPKIVHLAICVQMGKYVSSRYDDKTMSEIEKATDKALDDTLEGIWMNYQQRSFRVDYQVHPKAIFKQNLRCFIISVQLNYPMIPSNPKLTTKFKENLFSEFYILSEKENLNLKSFKYSGGFAFMKSVVKRSSGNCVNYEEKYANCTSRWNCLERCINKAFMERYNRISFGTYYEPLVVDQDWFSRTDWNTSRQIYNDSIYEDIRAKCLQELPDMKACLEIKFEETVEITKPHPQILEIDLQFEVVWSFEQNPSSWYKLTLDILSIESIFFGLTVLSILQRVCFYIQTTLKVSENKIFLIFNYLLCSLGASWHAYHILHLVINGELVPTEHYELAKRVQMPEMVFCDQIDAKLIDSNHRLTGNYLEELTRELNMERMFANVTYLDESNKWKPLNLNLVEPFFFLDMKCFRIQIDQEYERDQFHFSSDYQVLKVNFSKTTDERKLVYFMTKAKKTVEFSKMVNLTYRWNGWDSIWSPSHLITHETSVYKYEDRFNFFRTHFPPVQEDDASNLHGQLVELRGNEHNLWTLNFPVKKNGFDSELQEDLFEQLFSVRKNRKQRMNLNYQDMFFSNHLKRDHLYKNSAFTFSLVFLQKIIHSTNEINYAALILSLLNMLYIWLEFSLLDMQSYLVYFHDYFLVYLYFHMPIFFLRKTNLILFFCIRWLRKFEPKLYKRISARKKITRRVRPV